MEEENGFSFIILWDEDFQESTQKQLKVRNSLIEKGQGSEAGEEERTKGQETQVEKSK